MIWKPFVYRADENTHNRWCYLLFGKADETLVIRCYASNVSVVVDSVAWCSFVRSSVRLYKIWPLSEKEMKKQKTNNITYYSRSIYIMHTRTYERIRCTLCWVLRVYNVYVWPSECFPSTLGNIQRTSAYLFSVFHFRTMRTCKVYEFLVWFPLIFDTIDVYVRHGRAMQNRVYVWLVLSRILPRHFYFLLSWTYNVYKGKQNDEWYVLANNPNYRPIIRISRVSQTKNDLFVWKSRTHNISLIGYDHYDSIQLLQHVSTNESESAFSHNVFGVFKWLSNEILFCF